MESWTRSLEYFLVGVACGVRQVGGYHNKFSESLSKIYSTTINQQPPVNSKFLSKVGVAIRDSGFRKYLLCYTDMD